MAAKGNGTKDLDQYILQKYQSHIDAYRKTAEQNRRQYQRFRALNIVLGALVTLITTFLSANFVRSSQLLETTFLIAAPLLAVSLTIMNGFSQLFPWSSIWRDAAITAISLERGLDNYLASSPTTRNPKKELEKINILIEEETKTFFKQLSSHEKEIERKRATRKT